MGSEIPVVQIPRCLIESDLFSINEGGQKSDQRVIQVHVDEAGEFEYELKHTGPPLGPKHLALWRALFVLASLRKEFGMERADVIVLRDEELVSMAATGIGAAKAILHDLADARIERNHKDPERRAGWARSRLVHEVLTDEEYCLAEVRVNLSAGGAFTAWLEEAGYVGCVPTDEEIEFASRPTLTMRSFRELFSTLFEPVHLDENGDVLTIEEVQRVRRRRHRTPGFVYILTNPSMPGLIKIGKTRLNPIDRAAQLHTTGVPAGFQVEYACRTPDPEAVEQAMHVAFGPTRLSHKREFFQITPEQAIAVLSLHHQEEPIAA